MKNSIRVLITAEQVYPVNRRRIIQTARQTISRFGLAGVVEVSIVLVDSRLISRLNQKYRRKQGPTDVLSFSLPAPEIPDGVIRLGEVIIAWPVAKQQAAAHQISLDREIDNLVEHGVNHLLGIHHD